MKACVERPTSTPLEAEPAVYLSHQTREDGREEGLPGCPVRQDGCPLGIAELNVALESFTSLSAPNGDCSSESNLLGGNPLKDKEESASMSWIAEHDDARAKLSQADFVEGEQRPFPIWNIAGNVDSGAGDGESVAAPFEAQGNDQGRSIRGIPRSNTATVTTRCDTSIVGTLTRDFSGTWQPQGLLSGTLEEIDSRQVKAGACSMPAMVLSGKAPDDLPNGPSSYPERHSHPSTPLVNAIQLNRHCMTMTPFMSVSSIFSTSARSMSLVRTSVQHLTSNSQQQCCASSAHAAGQEVPPIGAIVDSETRSFPASPLEAESAPALGVVKATLREEIFMCTSAQKSNSSKVVLPLDVSVLSAQNSTVAAQQASPRNPCAPTLPCTPVANSVSSVSVERCVQEERRERSALVKDEAKCFQSILAREVSAYLILSRQLQKAARQFSEYIGVIAQRNHLENAASQFRDIMWARMRGEEAEHQKALKTYRLIEPVSLPNVDERSQQMKSVEDRAEMSGAARSFPCGVPHLSSPTPSMDEILCPSPPPWQPSREARSAAPSDAPQSCDRLVSSEIQRQLRLGRHSSRKADAWTDEAPFAELR